MRRHRTLLLGVVATIGGCTGSQATAPAQAAAEPVTAAADPPKVVPEPAEAGPPKPCSWKAGNTKAPPCTD